MGDSLEASVRNIDRFEVRQILGEGGQGIVYLAHDPKLKRDVAIKTLTAATGDDPGAYLESTFGPAMDGLRAIEPARL